MYRNTLQLLTSFDIVFDIFSGHGRSATRKRENNNLLTKSFVTLQL